MNNEFLNLPKDAQIALIKSAENSLGLVDSVIEKDLWVCELLEIIFSMPYNMVFRGLKCLFATCTYQLHNNLLLTVVVGDLERQANVWET